MSQIALSVHTTAEADKCKLSRRIGGGVVWNTRRQKHSASPRSIILADAREQSHYFRAPILESTKELQSMVWRADRKTLYAKGKHIRSAKLRQLGVEMEMRGSQVTLTKCFSISILVVIN
jgi:hypothetical protein